MDLIYKERLTVEYLMENYTKEELMKIFKYQMINNTPVLAPEDIEMILELPDDHPYLTRPEAEAE